MFIVFYESKLEKGYNIELASYVSIAYLLKLFDLLSFQLRIHGPAASALPGSLLEIHILLPHPRPTES